MQPFLALITPLGGHGGGDPPGIWGPTDPRPGWGLPPAGPGAPPGTWGGSGQPFPGYGLPGQPPGIWGPNDPRPGWGLPGGGGGSGGGSPPGIWGGGNQPFPQPPIHIPGHEGGGSPPGTWGGSGTPMPNPPIYLPPEDGGGEPPDFSGGYPKGWEIAWSPRYGYIWVASSGKPQPIPTPPGGGASKPPGQVANPIQPTPAPKQK